MTARRTSVLALVVLIGGLLLPARAAGAATVSLQTVPALAGVQLHVGDRHVSTGQDGSAQLTVPALAGVAREVGLDSGAVGDSTTVMIRKVLILQRARQRTVLGVGLDVSSSVRLAVDTGTTGLSPAAVRSARLHSSLGEVLDVDPAGGPVQILARRARLVAGVLVAEHVSWSLDGVKTTSTKAVASASRGFDPFGQTAWTLRLRPVAGVVDLQTMPATSGVAFLLEGQRVTTGPDGRAQVPVADLNGVDTQLRIDGAAGSVFATLLRVTRLPPQAAYHRRLLAALAVSRAVSLRFVDASGKPLDPARVEEVELRGDAGTVKVVGHQVSSPVRLLASVASRVDGTWQSRTIRYAVSTVRLDGGNAVFAGRQSFEPVRGSTWKVSLSVFDLTVRVRDALFGRQIASRGVLVRPDGTRQQVDLGAPSRPGALPSLVRGLYALDIEGAVMGGSTHVLVSRDEAVDLRVVTLLDAIIALAALVLLTLGAMVAARLLAGAGPRVRARGDD